MEKQTPESVVALARKLWPDATGIKIAPPTILWGPDMGTKITPWVLTRYVRDCDGDELGSYFTGSSLDDLAARMQS